VPALAYAYDIVCNGNEIGGGSIRIHRRDVQERVFEVMGLAPEEAQEKFGFLCSTPSSSAPHPHGGIAFGWDRIVMLLERFRQSIRDVIAFPKSGGGYDPLTDAPAPITAPSARRGRCTPEVDRAAFAETMATFLTRLHTAPVVEAALVTEMDPRSAAQWLVDTATAWAAVADRTPVTLRDRVDEFLVGPAPNDVRRITFCHNDLGDEHVVLSEDGGHVRGVIDWSDAVLGDPARDLGLLTLDFGPGIVDALIDDYHGPTGADFRGRVLWFAATAGVEGLAWRLANARPWQVTADRLRDVLAVLA
jgi:hypothetical protein